MKILVTGGAGFIGSNLADALIVQGHQVAVLDNLSSGKKGNISSQAEFFNVDVTSDTLAEVFTAFKPQAVFHLAAHIDVRKSVADPMWDATQNILGSINLFEQCRKHDVSKVIFSSSGGAIYGNTDQLPTTETHPEEPISPYGITKLAIEKYLNYYHKVYGLNYVALRYSNVYGPRQNATGEGAVVAIFTAKFLAGQMPTINGDGEQTRDYVYVGDVVAANLTALEKDICGVYNIGTGKETSVNELAKLIMAHTNSSVVPDYAQARIGEVLRSCLDYRLAQQVLSWEPKVDLQQGIARTVDWLISNQ